MRKSTIITAFVAMLLIMATAGSARAQEQAAVNINTTVEREVTPDELYLRITIKESDYKGKKSLEEMQEAMIGALKACRIDVPECLSLNYMGSEVGYKLFSSKIKPKTEATYTLKLYDVVIMQQVIAALEKRQISNIALDRVNFTKEKELKKEMAVEAMQQAQSEAKTLAMAIGQDIGKAISINTWMNKGQIQPRLYRTAKYADSNEAAVVEESAGATPFGIGKITYSFTVNARFELK